MEPAIVRASNEAIVRRDGDGEKVEIGREGGERIPGFEVPELERLVGGSGQRVRQRRHRHFALRWPAQKASYAGRGPGGSEVSLCITARDLLATENIRARVVSMPSWELFDAQDPAYQQSVL